MKDQPGRKAVVLFAAGVDVPPGSEHLVAALTGLACRFRISFYGVDPRGPETPRQAIDVAGGTGEEEITGWMTPTSGAKSEADLPAKARQYLERLEELSGVPFCLISTGPQREETILCEDSPLTRWFPSVRSSII